MTAKIVLAVVVLLCGLFVFLPYAKCFRKSEKGQCCKGKFVTMTTCFAAGMLLSMSVVHVLPEANEMYGDYMKELHEAEEKAELAILKD